ncbi:hypothetical protein Mucpa_6647 [Mucilaginibacter paludis DSM 18603]|uniref:Uncharacterized protein n=1 Tax=Mucilaginibacter paludis DSM 18603 TaxID=714943 RepID=H1YDK9_9SPHI|nr:hypothetical protein Mucpa_6647 [Mucilaginibacter paludis DSM 18603]
MQEFNRIHGISITDTLCVRRFPLGCIYLPSDLKLLSAGYQKTLNKMISNSQRFSAYQDVG